MGKLKLSAAGALAKRVLIPIILKRLQNPAFRDRILDKLNEKIDLPRLTEAEEKKVFGNIYDALDGVLLALLDEDND